MSTTGEDVEERRGGHVWEGPWPRPLIAAAVVVMAAAAVPWLAYEFWRLLWQPVELAGRAVHPGAIDLLERFDETRNWFASRPVLNPVYPPASYLMLWPLLGWAPVRWAIVLWAVTSLAALGWLMAVAVRASGARRGLARIFVALIPLSMYATGATIGNGQLNLHILPVIVAGVLLLRRDVPTWSRDLRGSALILASLVKPNISAPFFWIVTVGLGRLRVVALVVLGYVVLTLAASPFQPGGPVRQIRTWITFGADSAFWSAALAPETVNNWATQLSMNPAQYVLSLVGLQQWTPAWSLLVLAALGIWVRRHRHVDAWLLLGVSAIAARFWTYHRWYDDLVILLPMIALARMAHAEAAPGRRAAGWLLLASILTCLAPGGLFVLPPPWIGIYVLAQLAVWLIVLAALLHWARRGSPPPAWGET